ncbi:unnamed protein product [Periconia digitata]|uniref:BZIP domain-containing protein n=1 Tax=Periconia digitata TaxID=1303443 RepID=A0A9W4XM80_9PLEO|nr:unnamed protein product [Periconia digitata]
MAPRTQPTDDDWTSVTDAKKRKQIQDRLAQRARRQRLREAKSSTKQQKQQDETSGADETQGDQLPGTQPLPELSQGFSSTLFDLPSFTDIDLNLMPDDLDIAKCPLSLMTNQLQSLGNCSEENEAMPQTVVNKASPSSLDSYSLTPTTSKVSGLLSSLYGQPSFPMTVYTAMYINGDMLGLTCGTIIPSRSSPCGPDIPLPLQPTYKQLTVLHCRWIDRFPFPKMRDNIISLGGLVDDEELLRDMFTMPCFEIAPGKLPWDPKAWTLLRPFADKWGYLFL